VVPRSSIQGSCQMPFLPSMPRCWPPFCGQ
jgi:hypothetical protein